ncbi:MAG: type II toxin-antitoxin system VapC family toxin [Lachnospiraceae bacterium]|nr:type II toxin-antitoxin system VapC family toxin [Lachnospiraceae bacterium]
MLDTNICIYTIKHTSELLLNKFINHNPDDICISSITYAELMHGVYKSQAKEKNELAVSLFLSPITILDFDAVAAREYGIIRAELEKKGTPIGPMDMLIAGHAKSENLVLVTNNKREFERVEDLIIEDWTE